MPRTCSRPSKQALLLSLAYSRVLTWVVEALLTTLVEGVGCVLASLIVVKECCASTLITIPP